MVVVDRGITDRAGSMVVVDRGITDRAGSMVVVAAVQTADERGTSTLNSQITITIGASPGESS